MEYDIHVLAFPAASPRTVQGLCDLFGLDVRSAERIIDGVPLVLRQRVPVAEAEACAAALRKLGARVVLEPPQQREPPPPPAAAYLQHTAHWPGRGAHDALPQPAPRTPAPDLEYDVLSALDAALDGPAPPTAAALPRDLGDALGLPDLEEAMDSGPDPDDRGLSQRRHDELDLGAASPRASMELELAGPPAQTRGRAQTAAVRPVTAPKKLEPGSERDAPGLTTQPRLPVAPTGASRAALVDRRAPEPPPSRSIPLLRLLAAFSVFAIGYWAESSVIYGSASLVSVVAHGLALQQLLLGLRGMFR